MRQCLFAAAALLLAAPLAAFAGTEGDGGPPRDGPPHDGPAHDGPPHGAPAEAIAACKGKASGTSVTFTDRGGRTLTGVCTLIAVPQPPHHPGDKNGPPPAQ